VPLVRYLATSSRENGVCTAAVAVFSQGRLGTLKVESTREVGWRFAALNFSLTHSSYLIHLFRNNSTRGVGDGSQVHL
jgi:hypothetical protein